MTTAESRNAYTWTWCTTIQNKLTPNLLLSQWAQIPLSERVNLTLLNHKIWLLIYFLGVQQITDWYVWHNTNLTLTPKDNKWVTQKVLCDEACQPHPNTNIFCDSNICEHRNINSFLRNKNVYWTANFKSFVVISREKWKLLNEHNLINNHPQNRDFHSPELTFIHIIQF
jgi:hypothetical protein